MMPQIDFHLFSTHLKDESCLNPMMVMFITIVQWPPGGQWWTKRVILENWRLSELAPRPGRRWEKAFIIYPRNIWATNWSPDLTSKKQTQIGGRFEECFHLTILTFLFRMNHEYGKGRIDALVLQPRFHKFTANPNLKWASITLDDSLHSQIL